MYFHPMTIVLFIQHFQRDIVRGVEGYIVTGSKQIEIGISLKLCLSCPFPIFKSGMPMI